MLQVPEEMRPSWTLYLGMSSFKQKYPNTGIPHGVSPCVSFLLSPPFFVSCQPVLGKDFL